jgi:hypothetical protein
MTSERGIERDLSGTVVLVDAMLSSVQLQTTGASSLFFAAPDRLLRSAKDVPARTHPLRVL